MKNPTQSKYQVLVIEDDSCMVQAVRSALPVEAAAVSAANGREARRMLEKEAFDLILLDLKLPDDDGMDLCSWIRSDYRHEATPVVFITGEYEVDDKVKAFSLGADDYLVKPFDLREFRARVSAKLRRANVAARREESLCKGNIKLVIAGQRILMDRGAGLFETIDASPLEFRLLLLLAKNDHRAFSREELLSKVWGDHINVLERTVDSHISDLRRKLVGATHTIQAIRGVGYQLVEIQALFSRQKGL